MSEIETQLSIETETKNLIDSLKATCHKYGLGNDGNEYKIITQVFLYKYLNDKFGVDAKNNPVYGGRLKDSEKWDQEYDKFSEDEVEDLFSYLPSGTPRLKPHHTLAHLYNAQQQGDFSTLLDATMVDIANLNADIFSMATSKKTKVTIFENITTLIQDPQDRDPFALAIVTNLAKFNFEKVFDQKYDFFSVIFEYLIKDYNKDGGGTYAEYYTPRSIAGIMAKLLVSDNANLNSVTCYDPSAGSGTLLMALAHQIGEDRCQIYSQDISQKSSQMLRLNLILNNLVGSIQNIIKGNTLTEPYHKELDGSLKKFDYIVSNPPFKLDFSDDRTYLANDRIRFWAGVPNIPNTKKEDMAIYTCFVQHVINSLNEKGKAAIVVPTGFITSKSGIGKKILEKLVNDKMLMGVVTMPSNIFATTNTNVSVVFMDKENKNGKVCLIDASNLGTKVKEDGNQRTLLSEDDISKIIDCFRNKKDVSKFSTNVTYDEIKEKGYTLSAGQYFSISIEHIDISEAEFNEKIANYKSILSDLYAETENLNKKIIQNIGSLSFGDN